MAENETGSSKFHDVLSWPSWLRTAENLGQVQVTQNFDGLVSTSRLKAAKKTKSKNLCSNCSQINFAQFRQADNGSGSVEKDPITPTLLFMDRILKKRKDCTICELLFKAICEHSPFDHPSVKEYFPIALKGKTFEQWADGRNWAEKNMSLYYGGDWPFGSSRDLVDIELTEKEPKKGERPFEPQRAQDIKLSFTNILKILGNEGLVNPRDAITARLSISKLLSELLPALSVTMSGLKWKLPVAVSLFMHNKGFPDEGLLLVDVWGYGNKPGVDVSRLSSFSLFVKSRLGVTNKPETLQYGQEIEKYVRVGEQCRQWLDHCKDKHQHHCDRPDWSEVLEVPTGKFRLIDVDEASGMRIVELGKDEGIDSVLSGGGISTTGIGEDGHGDGKRSLSIEYAALSYVWGDTMRTKLRLLNENKHLLTHPGGLQDAQTWRDVATTIKDAIKVTRELGLRYLWVDSLCIIQNDEEEPYKIQQIQQMDRIFGHATVTIVAAEGADGDHGLPGVSRLRQTGHQLKSEEIMKEIIVLAAVKPDDYLGVWETRAWTLQEKLLSKRLLVFTEKMVFFNCKMEALNEDMPDVERSRKTSWLSRPEGDRGSELARRRDNTFDLLSSPYFRQYAQLLKQYTGRDMTNPGDAVNGIGGLLNFLEVISETNDGETRELSEDGKSRDTIPRAHTLFGVPEQFHDLALLWQPPSIPGVTLERRDFPSWSWAGWYARKDDVHSRHSTTPVEDYGIRFEQPFRVFTEDDGSLEKVLADERGYGLPAERYKPSVLWYKYVPVKSMRLQRPQSPPPKPPSLYRIWQLG